MIEVGERHRALSDNAVDRLAASMGELGLRHPITIRLVDDVVLPDGEICDGVPYLVAGRHRLAAAKKLGWQEIECVEVGGDEIDAELWEISENLHRLDLSKEQRDEHVRRYAELKEARRVQDGQSVQLESKREDGRGHQRKSVATEVAEETGLSARTVRRILHNEPSKAPPREVYDEREARRGRAMNAWNKLDEEDRAWFRDWIDTPIMDNRYD